MQSGDGSWPEANPRRRSVRAQQDLDHDPVVGSVASAAAYTGTPFRLNRQYGERFGDAWVVLSAKYGFLPPDLMIPGPNQVSFKRPATGHISVGRLRDEVREQALDPYQIVVGQGGENDPATVEAAFAPTHVSPEASCPRSPENPWESTSPSYVSVRLCGTLPVCGCSPTRHRYMLAAKGRSPVL